MRTLHTKCSLPFILISCVLSQELNAQIYCEDFSSATTQGLSTQATLGFWGPNFATFNDITVASDATVQNMELFLNSTSSNQFRGIGIALEAASFPSVGTYTLEYDIVDFQLSSPFGSTFNDAFEARVWTGNGYVQNSADGLVIDAQTGHLLPTAGSSATATQIANQSISFQDSPNTGTFTLDFNYDGSDAVVIYLGAVADGFPFPEITIDNICVDVAVPEPASATLLALGLFALTARRRK